MKWSVIDNWQESEVCVIATQSHVVFFDLLINRWILRLNRAISGVWGLLSLDWVSLPYTQLCS